MEKTYHHGNLREALLKAGIELINREGTEKLSLRRAAQLCGVSHNAPYSHFSNKEEYLRQIKKYVEDKFAVILENAAAKGGMNRGLLEVGKAYVRFFSENPSYFTFLMAQEDLDIYLSAEMVDAAHYRPFQIFKVVSEKVLCQFFSPREDMADQIIRMWVTVQGLASLAIMPGVTFEGDWEAYVEHMLRICCDFSQNTHKEEGGCSRQPAVGKGMEGEGQ